VYECKDNQLTVRWPSDKIFAVDTLIIPAALNEKLKERIDNFIMADDIEIIILTHQPP